MTRVSCRHLARGFWNFVGTGRALGFGFRFVEPRIFLEISFVDVRVCSLCFFGGVGHGAARLSNTKASFCWWYMFECIGFFKLELLLPVR